MAGQQICLKWNSFQTNIVTSFENLWEEEGLVDVTLASDGQCIRAHKVILSACSPFFRQVFQSNPCQHPVIILQDVHFSELESLLCFVYKGEVNIGQENLPALLKAAETLQIRGLSGASEQVKEKMAIPRKAPCPENTETPVLHPPNKRHKGCGTSPPPTIPPLSHQPLDEVLPSMTMPSLALTAKTMTLTEGLQQAQVEGLQMPVVPSCGESMTAVDAAIMQDEAGEEGLVAQQGGEGAEGREGEVGEGQEVVEGGDGLAGGEGGGEAEGADGGEETTVGEVAAVLGGGVEDGGEEDEDDDDEDRPLAHLSLKMEPPEFDYPCDSNSLPLALTLTLPNSAEEINLPSVMSKSRRVSDCHGDASLLKGEDIQASGGNNGLQQRRRSRSRGISGGGGSGARRKRRHCNNFIWRTAPACSNPLLPQMTLSTDNGDASGCHLGGEGGDDGGGAAGMLLLTPTHPSAATLTSDHHAEEDEDDSKSKKAKQRAATAAVGVSDEEAELMVGAGEVGEGASSAPLPPYSLLPHACLLPSPSILSAWAKARTPEQLSCDLMRLLFSTEERLVCNVNGKMGKRRFDAHKVLLIREVVRHHYNECSGAGGRHGGSGGEEGGDESGERTVTDFEERWKGCVTRIDTANRGLKRNLVLRGRKASFLV